jgi:hypothetical protein
MLRLVAVPAGNKPDTRVVARSLQVKESVVAERLHSDQSPLL